jgi:hypothetical protein
VTLGSAIKLIRTAKGVKQLTLAKQLEVSPNYISLVEKDRRDPSVGFLKRLARELGVPVGLFFLWQDTGDSDRSNRDMVELRELLSRIQALYLRNLNPGSENEDAA